MNERKQKAVLAFVALFISWLSFAAGLWCAVNP